MEAGRRARTGGLLLGLAALAATASAASPASAEAVAEARQVVVETVQSVLGILRDRALSDDDKRQRIEQVAYQRFDFPTVSRLVLARNWRRLTPRQREEFTQEFKQHLSLTYGKNVERYADEDVAVDQARAESNGDVTVRTRVLGGAAEAYLVDYRLRRGGGEWGIIDVIVEGVSLLQNFRTQTQELISNVGPEGLIEKLRSKNEARTAKGG